MDGARNLHIGTLRDATRIFADAVSEPPGGALWERSRRIANTRRLQQTAMDVVRHWSRLSPVELLAWDRLARQGDEHAGLPIADLVKSTRCALDTADERIAFAGAMIGSTLPDGRLRQESVERLADPKTGGARLLVIRATDAVDAVRAAAMKAIQGIPLHELAEILPLVDRLATRRRAAPLLECVIAQFATPTGRSELVRALHHRDGAIRLAGWQTLCAAGWRPSEQVVFDQLKDSDIRLRACALDAAFALSRGQRRRAASIAATDSSEDIRARAVSLMWTIGTPPGVWTERCLSDQSRLVRGMVQERLRAAGRNPAAFYRARLSGDATPTDVLGAGECGGLSDVPRLRALLGHPRPAIRNAALRSLARLEPSTIAQIAERALDDPSREVVATALALLRGSQLDASVALRLEERAVHDQRPAIRLGALALLPKRTPWRRIGCLLQAMGDPSPLVRHDAEREFDRWLHHPRGTIGPPTGSEWAAIRQASTVLDDSRRQRISALALRGQQIGAQA